MRRLSLSDTIFYNLGDCYMNAAAVLDGPCDLAVLLAAMEGVIEAMPALTEQSKRIGLWTFAKRTSGQVDLTRHVSVIRDPSITRFEQIVPRLDKQRRSPIRIDGSAAASSMPLSIRETTPNARSSRSAVRTASAKLRPWR